MDQNNMVHIAKIVGTILIVLNILLAVIMCVRSKLRTSSRDATEDPSSVIIIISPDKPEVILRLYREEKDQTVPDVPSSVIINISPETPVNDHQTQQGTSSSEPDVPY